MDVACSRVRFSTGQSASMCLMVLQLLLWAVVGGTVLSVVAQIVATKTLSEGVGRLVGNDIRKDTSGGAENMLAEGSVML